MILGGIVGIVVAALVVVLAPRVPAADARFTQLRVASQAVPLAVWLGVPLAVVILVASLLGSGAAGAGSILLVVVVTLVLLLALAGAWSWARLRESR
ncbi:MAG: hypothetical protein ACYCS2_07905 [Acidimicrobiales bacterium]